MTRVLRVDPRQPDPAALAEGGAVLRAGGLVAFPTETVYGLGADATNGEAVGRVFTAKDRPADNPLIVHVASPGDVPGLGRRGRLLVEAFWPGPLSLVLPRWPGIAAEVGCGLPTVAVRMPDHPVALGLIARAGVPVAAPSANRSGRVSPTAAGHVLADLRGRVDLVLDGGPTRLGLESTVLDLTSDPPRVLRPGGVTLEELQQLVPGVVAGAPLGEPLPSPGTRYRHYAPRARVILVAAGGGELAAAMRELAGEHRRGGARVGALVRGSWEPGQLGVDIVHSLGESLAEVAAGLYAGLRALDAGGADVILAEAAFPGEGLGRAIGDRLRRAAGTHSGNQSPPGIQ
ncbi:MAG: L-threonylcarbamoyladenylate synthase [bacterium]|nr:L-threonylcarbamoyladenylate synthase [bacterium]